MTIRLSCASARGFSSGVVCSVFHTRQWKRTNLQSHSASDCTDSEYWTFVIDPAMSPKRRYHRITNNKPKPMINKRRLSAIAFKIERPIFSCCSLGTAAVCMSVIFPVPCGRDLAFETLSAIPLSTELISPSCVGNAVGLLVGLAVSLELGFSVDLAVAGLFVGAAEGGAVMGSPRPSTWSRHSKSTPVSFFTISTSFMKSVRA
mmetsp:Transcript_7240/g.10905  ORF Transcript_7240/g.10905 Transcript_7240/m.10905 type:complete len:204 (-) Transcript_7240:1003-1614(-)